MLHVVNNAICFSAETFSDAFDSSFGQPPQEIWLVLVMKWCLVYAVYPIQLCIDQESVFTFKKRKQLTDFNESQP